jgi:hypothetical protein
MFIEVIKDMVKKWRLMVTTTAQQKIQQKFVLSEKISIK